MNTLNVDLGEDVGLIGDVHGNLPFLIEAIFQLEARGATSLVQLGDFGMLWDGSAHERAGLSTLNKVLRAMDKDLFVVLGNHENYTMVDTVEPAADKSRTIGRVVILPRAGRLRAGKRSVGFLSGAGSVDRSSRRPRRSWWSNELPTDEEAQDLGDDLAPRVNILLAHDALRGPALKNRLASSRNLWNANDLAYAEAASDVFTARATAVLADGGLVLSGHYHFRHTANEMFTRPGKTGASIWLRSEILGAEWDEGAVGLLDTRTLAVQTWSIDQAAARIGYDALTTRTE